MATRTATQREAATAGGAATKPTVRAAVEEVAATVTEVGGSAAEDKAGKTRVELAANTPIGPGAGKAAAVAEKGPGYGVKRNDDVMGTETQCDAAARRGAPARAASAEETRGSGASVPGQVELTKPEHWDSMSRAAKKHWKKLREKHKQNETLVPRP